MCAIFISYAKIVRETVKVRSSNQIHYVIVVISFQSAARLR